CFGIVLTFEHLRLAFGIICDDYLQRIKYDHSSFRNLIQVFANAELEKSYIDHVVTTCYTYPVAKVAYALRRITAAAHSAYGGHTWIIPTLNVTFIDKAEEFALAHDSIVHVESRELILL